MTTAALTLLAASAALAWLFTVGMRALAIRAGLTDMPDGRRKLHKDAIPLAGGIAVFLAATVVLAGMLWIPNPWTEQLGDSWHKLLTLGAAGLVIVAVGAADDRFRLRGRQKLLGQLVAVAVLIAGGLVIRRVELFGWSLELGLLSVPFTGFWLLGATNAVNLLDGIDGLATVVGIILAATVAAMAAMTLHPDVAVVALVFAGCLIGFLRFNFPPASVFLGDAGSMLIGLMVGALAIHASCKGPGTVLLAAPAAACTIPIFDSAAAIVRRRLTGRSIYTTDRGHLHHRLMDRLGSNHRVLGWVALASLFTSSAALLSVSMKSDIIALLSLLAVVSIFIATGVFGRAELLLLGSRLHDVGQSLIPVGNGNLKRVRQSTVRFQGSHCWEELWAELVQAAGELALSEIRLDVNLPAAQEGYHACWRLPCFDEVAPCWQLDVPLVVGQYPIGRVRAACVSEGRQPADGIRRILEVLESYRLAGDKLGPELRLRGDHTQLASVVRRQEASVKEPRKPPVQQMQPPVPSPGIPLRAS